MTRMKKNHLFFLALTLSLFLIALAAHSVPASSLCVCTEPAGSTARTSGLETCLVCQLQTGVVTTNISPVIPDDELDEVDCPSSQIPQKHADQIPHPPALI